MTLLKHQRTHHASLMIVLVVLAVVTNSPSKSAGAAGADRDQRYLRKVAVIGDVDDRLSGSRFHARRQLGGQLGKWADDYFARALRIWFPFPGSLVVTGTPVCFPDVVVTAAHVYANMGDSTAKPRGLKVSVPDIVNPGEFRSTLSVADFHASTVAHQYDANRLPDVRDDFLVLRLSDPVPDDIMPLALLPFAEIKDLKAPPRCKTATVNSAYHADLGLLNQAVVNVEVDPGAGRIVAAGKAPIVTLSRTMSQKQRDGSRFGSWYNDPLVAFPEHDTHESASGSAVVCPGLSRPPGATPSDIKPMPEQRPPDYLHGLMVGQMFFDTLPAKSVGETRRGKMRPAINVATFNLPAIYRAIATLKQLPVETLHKACLLATD